MVKIEDGHIHFIDSLRAVAACIVMLFHFISYHNGIDFIYSNENIRTISEWGAQGVEMFYIISGFVISFALYKVDFSFNDIYKYLIKRVLRIVPPYILTIFLITFVSFILGTFFWSDPFVFDFKNTLANIFYFVDSIEGMTWINEIFVTLKVELQFYILFGLLFPILKLNKIYKYSILSILMLIGIYSIEYYTVFFNAPYFVTGIILYDVYNNRNINSLEGLSFVLILSWLYCFYTFQDVAITGLTMFYFLFVQKNYVFISKIGKVSYSLYLTHGFFGGWFLFFTSRDSYVNISPYITIPLACVISIIASNIFYKIIEKPSIKMSKSVKYTSIEKN